jgi:hypothetical protein
MKLNMFLKQPLIAKIPCETISLLETTLTTIGYLKTVLRLIIKQSPQFPLANVVCINQENQTEKNVFLAGLRSVLHFLRKVPRKWR